MEITFIARVEDWFFTKPAYIWHVHSFSTKNRARRKSHGMRRQKNSNETERCADASIGTFVLQHITKEQERERERESEKRRRRAVTRGAMRDANIYLGASARGGTREGYMRASAHARIGIAIIPPSKSIPSLYATRVDANETHWGLSRSR